MAKRSSKMPKMINFGEILKTWSLRSNSVTRFFKHCEFWILYLLYQLWIHASCPNLCPWQNPISYWRRASEVAHILSVSVLIREFVVVANKKMMQDVTVLWHQYFPFKSKPAKIIRSAVVVISQKSQQKSTSQTHQTKSHFQAFLSLALYSQCLKNSLKCLIPIFEYSKFQPPRMTGLAVYRGQTEGHNKGNANK